MPLQIPAPVTIEGNYTAWTGATAIDTTFPSGTLGYFTLRIDNNGKGLISSTSASKAVTIVGSAVTDITGANLLLAEDELENAQGVNPQQSVLAKYQLLRDINLRVHILKNGVAVFDFLPNYTNTTWQYILITISPNGKYVWVLWRDSVALKRYVQLFTGA